MPASSDDAATPLEVLRRDPARTAILLDFDGTLAPIVEDPAAAVPMPGAVEALIALQERFKVVAVVSGRPVAYLQERLSGLRSVIGLYGLEQVRDGRLELHPDAAPWRPVIQEVVAAARAELPEGVGVEDKGLSLTLHVRPRPDQAEVVERWAAAAAARTGLHVRRARMSAELHPPVTADKGTVTSALVTGMAAAAFVGDDIGDLPAFAALDSFEAGGGRAVRAVVMSAEVAPELLAAADLVLDGPLAVLDLLRALAG
jgi:trehalose 6-phosphate phosphatase